MRERPSPNLDRSRALMSVETDVIVVVVETCNHFHAGDKGNVFFLYKKAALKKQKKKFVRRKGAR